MAPVELITYLSAFWCVEPEVWADGLGGRAGVRGLADAKCVGQARLRMSKAKACDMHLKSNKIKIKYKIAGAERRRRRLMATTIQLGGLRLHRPHRCMSNGQYKLDGGGGVEL